MPTDTDTDTIAPPEAAEGRLLPAGPSRLLSEMPAKGAATLADHRRRYPVPPLPGRTPWTELIDVVERSGLRGRGGAGFPTGRKLRAVAGGGGGSASGSAVGSVGGPARGSAGGRGAGAAGRPVVVANGTEGEPASAKDRLLLTRVPHLVLDGVLLAAAAVGATEAVVCVDRMGSDAVDSVRRAVAERRAELAGFPLRLAATPPRYVAGEETALVHWLNGGPAKPTAGPTRPYQRGVGGRPTLVQNVETLAHLAQIARHGAEWFRLAGPADDPGTTLVTLGGAVRRPSILEAAVGTDMGRLVAGGGGVSSPPQALLVGGFFGAWVPADRAWGAPFSRTGLQPLGAAPGAGVVIVLPASACGLSETARVLRWYRGESAGQCGPCVHGLADIAAGTAALAAGTLPFAEVGRLRRWAGDIEGRGACRHPDGAVRLLRSALDVFAGDVLRHAHGDPCPGSRGTPVLAVPVPSDTWR